MQRKIRDAEGSDEEASQINVALTLTLNLTLSVTLSLTLALNTI